MSDVDYIAQAEKAYKEALDIVRKKEGWSTEKEDKKNQIIVQMKKNAQGRKIYLCTVSPSLKFKIYYLIFRPKLIFLPSFSFRRLRTLTASPVGTKRF